MKNLLVAVALIIGTGFAFGQQTHPSALQKVVKVDITKKTMPVTAQKNQRTKTVSINSNVSGMKLKKDGTPDKRYKENKRLKKDGTPDRRYKSN